MPALRFQDDRLRQIKLEDGEVVVPLGRSRCQRHEQPSSRAHAGVWSDSASYALLTSATRSGSVANSVRAFDSCLCLLRTDGELLIIGPDAVIERLIREGPPCLRARRKREPGSHLARYAFANGGQP